MREAFRTYFVWLGIFAAGVLVGAAFWKFLIIRLEPTIRLGLALAEAAKPSTLTAAALFLKNASVACLCAFMGRKGIVPFVVCSANGAILGSFAEFLGRHEIAWYKFALALAPHGVVELSAIFLACGIGITLYSFREKLKLMYVPLAMLVVAACMETWVSPLVACKVF